MLLRDPEGSGHPFLLVVVNPSEARVTSLVELPDLPRFSSRPARLVRMEAGYAVQTTEGLRLVSPTGQIVRSVAHTEGGKTYLADDGRAAVRDDLGLGADGRPRWRHAIPEGGSRISRSMRCGASFCCVSGDDLVQLSADDGSETGRAALEPGPTRCAEPTHEPYRRGVRGRTGGECLRR